MRLFPLLPALLCLTVSGVLLAAESPPETPPSLTARLSFSAESLAAGAKGAVDSLIDSGMELLGVRYRRGGNTPETGFDCSGFVRHVFSETLGVLLPRSSLEMARIGMTVGKEELRPGDLVFFNTLSRTISHVGIYLGDHKFLHSNSSGGGVRVDDMRLPYWIKHFRGARRVDPTTPAP